MTPLPILDLPRVYSGWDRLALLFEVKSWAMFDPLAFVARRGEKPDLPIFCGERPLLLVSTVPPPTFILLSSGYFYIPELLTSLL